jgi:hypothetical protein
MGSVYLIRQTDLDGNELYKIGITKRRIETRLSCLQTGNPHKLDLQGFYKSEFYNKIEKWMHRKYTSKRLEGEWFDLTNKDVVNFHEDCKKIEATIKTLIAYNPFFN